jgi:tetratricopeptide (TPR) repeat protein
MTLQRTETDLSSAKQALLAKAPVRARLKTAAALRKASRFEAAEAVYKSVLENQPNSYGALLNLGYLARRRGDQAASLGYFEAAHAADPRQKRAKLEMAAELRKLSRLEEAEALYRSILEDQPDQVRALAGLGRIAQARGNADLALRYYQAAVAADPGRTDLKLKIASQLRKLSRKNEAKQAYLGILAEEPDHAVARAGLETLAKRKKAILQPMERSWLELETFTRADEWGRNLETLGIPAYGTSLLALALDLARGGSEEVKQDCIIIRQDRWIKMLPFVSDWKEYYQILEREATRLPSRTLLGYVPEQPEGGSDNKYKIVQSHREYVYHRESAASLVGSSLSKYRQEIRSLLKIGAHVEPIGPTNLDRVLACNDRWYSRKKESGLATYHNRYTAWSFENLPLLEVLGVRHLALILNGDVIGYGVGGPLGVSWFAFTYRRNDPEPAGMAPYLLSELAKLYPDRQWINDGPAIRNPGLAWFKQRFTTNAAEKQMTLGWIRV